MHKRIFIKAKQLTEIKHGYNYYLTSAIYKIIDTKLSRNFSHESKQLKLLKITPIVFNTKECFFSKNSNPNVLFITNGSGFFDISSLDTTFTNVLSEVLLENVTLNLNGFDFLITKVEEQPAPVLSESQYWQVNSISPLLVKRVIKNNTSIKYNFLTPDSEEFTLHLKQNLLHKWNRYSAFNSSIQKLSESDISITSLGTGKVVQRQFKGNKMSVVQNLIIEVKAPIEIQNLIYNLGLGNKNNFGFGNVQPLYKK